MCNVSPAFGARGNLYTCNYHFSQLQVLMIKNWMKETFSGCDMADSCLAQRIWYFILC